MFEENTILGKVSSKDKEGITDEMIACIKTEGAGESTGRLIEHLSEQKLHQLCLKYQ